MRLFSWLFHPVNLLIVVVLLVLYLNRQLLFPEISGSSDVQQLVGRVDRVIDSMGEPAKRAPGIPADSADNEGQPGEEVAEPAGVSANPAETDAMQSVPMHLPNDLPEVGVTDEPVEGLERATAESEKSPEKQAAEPSTDNNPTRLRSDDADPLELWRKARQAAWNNQPSLAIKHYRSLIALQPNHYDAYGEMGNVMLRTGDSQSAVSAYYQAAKLLNQSGYPQQAWQLQDVVARLDYTKGHELYQELLQQQSAPQLSKE